MSLMVQKYGGTSVSNAKKISAIAQRIQKLRINGHDVVTIVSAKGGMTDHLLEQAKEFSDRPDARSLDLLLGVGEQENSALLSIALNALGVKTIAFTAHQAKIFTDNVHRHAEITRIDPAPIRQAIEQGYVVIVAGFQGISEESGDLTTLGRGGSDLTAIALTHFLQADCCQIFTDVDGVFNTDPHNVPEAELIPEVSLKDLCIFAAMGAKVMQHQALEFAQKHHVAFEVGSYITGNMGTLVKMHSLYSLQGIAIKKHQYVCSLSSESDIAREMFLQGIAQQHIPIDILSGEKPLIFSFSSEDHGFIVDLVHKTPKLSWQIARDQVTKVSIVGENLMFEKGFEAKLDHQETIFKFPHRLTWIVEPCRANALVKELYEKLSKQEIVCEHTTKKLCPAAI